MFYDIIKADYLNKYRIKLSFEDNGQGVVNLSNYPDPDNIFKSFLDLKFFKKFRIEYGTLVWGNGELDIAPETLYTKATGKKIVYDNWKNVV